MVFEKLKQQKQKLESYFKADPKNTTLAHQIIDLNFQLGDYQEVINIIDSIEASHSNDALAFKKSNALLSLGKAQEALAVLETISINPESQTAVQINKAHAQFQLGNFIEVNQLLKDLDVESSLSTIILQARSYHHMGDMENAIHLLERANTKFPDNAEIKGLLSLLMLDEGNFDQQTLDCAEQALSSKPNQLEGLLTAGMMYQHYVKDLVKAESYFDKVIKEYPAVGRGWLYKGLAVMLRSELIEARGFLRKACELMPEHIGSWHSLAWSYILHGQADEAAECYEKALLLDRNFAETHGGISIVQSMKGDNNQAEKTARLALRLNPQCLSAQYTLMLINNSKNHQQEASEILKNVLNTEQGIEAQEFIKVLQGQNNKV